MVDKDKTAPTWQCVLIAWGDKYGVDVINGLVDSVVRYAKITPRFVLITDRERVGLNTNIQCVDFPQYWLDAPLLRSGCQAKLVMFERGIVPEDLPAIYLDLDTMILGDLGVLLSLLRTQQTVAMLHSAIIPFGAIGRALYRYTNKRRYARGNSSITVYHPAHCHYISEHFRKLYAQHPNFEFRPMIADERFISWVAQPHMRTVPNRWGVKFSREYMFVWAPWLYIKALLPWVRKRRSQQLAVTLAGMFIKPEKLLALPEGAVIIDEHRRRLVWSKKTMGNMKAVVANYYKHLDT